MMWHKSIMRTTIDIPDHVLIEAKQLAAQQRRPLTVLVTESLRRYLAEERRRTPKRATPRLPSNKTARACSNIDLSDTSALWSIDDSL
jgi:hypothetical protein